MKDVPYFAIDSASAVFNKANRRLFVIILMLVFFLVGTNALWIKYHLSHSNPHYCDCPYYTQHGVIETDDDKD